MSDVRDADEAGSKRGNHLAMWIGIGVALGIALSIAIGVAIGTALDAKNIYQPRTS